MSLAPLKGKLLIASLQIPSSLRRPHYNSADIHNSGYDLLVLRGQLLIHFCPHTALGRLLTWVLHGRLGSATGTHVSGSLKLEISPGCGQAFPQTAAVSLQPVSCLAFCKRQSLTSRPLTSSRCHYSLRMSSLKAAMGDL